MNIIAGYSDIIAQSVMYGSLANVPIRYSAPARAQSARQDARVLIIGSKGYRKVRKVLSLPLQAILQRAS